MSKKLTGIIQRISKPVYRQPSQYAMAVFFDKRCVVELDENIQYGLRPATVGRPADDIPPQPVINR